MKRIWWIPISLLLLTGCVPSGTDEETEVINEEEEVETAIIPSMQLDDQFYRTLLPYKESATRGKIVNRLNSRYDITETENGLLRLSQKQFSPDDYYFQEGQKITDEDVTAWLQRVSKDNPAGLNAADERTAAQKEAGDRAPAEILAHVIEQNYLVKTDEETIRLGGISVGLALNSVYYSSEDGISYEEEIPREQIEKEGKRMADEIVKRLREKEGLGDVPIVVGLFEQNSRNAMVPGTYFSYGAAPGGQEAVANWTAVNEAYVLFPTAGTDERYRDIDTAFRNFKQDVEIYFSNFTSVIGTGFYQENELKELKIEIPIQFYGAAEVIGFTQYVTGLVGEHFPENVLVEVSVTSTNGPEALVLRKAGETEPFVHIYE
ncbi:protein involved in sex pheromone biosynthesis [Planomicrobium stackebrandtii]|uniref:Protein involved in sex pheromone biosynthesis n=1 Tax=Planomicrobium stackebrandtii TaxID=253160 RepID=A0ABU0GZ31_9BACL|nr:CamS family sex pheromone protein [Planomicrobium stackebrandtii]MDQ0430609.1 protein involved in sex pheromone biosynthesis [Planomicrobium stackebrandtii]